MRNLRQKMNSINIIAIVIAITIGSTDCCSCVTPKPKEAICGSDGTTWGSNCTLFCTAFYRDEKTQPCLTRVHDGPCDARPCICNDPCKYVCGSDGATYGNDCTLECARKKNKRLRKVKNGRCGRIIN